MRPVALGNLDDPYQTRKVAVKHSVTRSCRKRLLVVAETLPKDKWFTEVEKPRWKLALLLSLQSTSLSVSSLHSRTR
jgi:hypothetical protein